MNRKAIRHNILYAALRLLLALLGRVPLAAHRFTARTLTLLASALARCEWRRCRVQLKSHLLQGRNNSRVGTLQKGVFIHLALSVLELCYLIRRPGALPAVSFSNGSLDALHNSLATRKGVLFITGHIGNWELMAIALARQGFIINTVAAPSYDHRMTRYIEDRRREFGVHPIYRESPGSAVKMLRALKRNEILGFLIDQDTRVKSVFAPFFGKLASTPSGPAELARRTGAPVVVGTIHRSAGGAHVITIEPKTLPPDVTEATALLTAELERRIRRHPSEWIWFHRRWKTRPD